MTPVFSWFICTKTTFNESLIQLFFFKSTIYYTERGGRPWQLLRNYVQMDGIDMKKKEREREEKREKKVRETDEEGKHEK